MRPVGTRQSCSFGVQVVAFSVVGSREASGWLLCQGSTLVFVALAAFAFENTGCHFLFCTKV